MSRDSKIWWGILSFIPLIGCIAAFLLLFNSIYPLLMEALQTDQAPDLNLLISKLMQIWIVLAAISLLSAFIWIFFLVFSIRDKSSKGDEQVLWVLLLFFFSLLALPIYWYLRMWKNPAFGFEENLTQRTN